jgi:hypothetical protein
MRLGRLQWGAIGIATLLIVVMAPSGNESGSGQSARPENRLSGGSANASTADRQRAHEAGHVDMERLSKLEMRNKEKNNVGDAFNTNSWYQPPPPPTHPVLPNNLVVPLPPPVVVQTAPPLPFTYLGRYGDTPSRTVILSKGDRVYTVTVGDVIENSYRVEKFTPGMINLTYLPLNIEQHLATGETL